jgi:enoyl-CoA hydratase/carnithine racemase
VQRAKHWLLSARLFSADDAVESGLSVAAFPDNQLEEATLALISESIVGSRSATGAMKQLIRIVQENDLQTGLERERRAVLRYVLDTEEVRRGLQRFAEREQPGPGVVGER